MPAPADFLKFVDGNEEAFIQRLASAVEIPSISGDPVHREDVFRMASFLESQLQAYGVETKSVPLGSHELDGQKLQLPPAILGRIGNDKSKKTVLIYGHFDVQPAELSDGWTHPPFKLTRDESTGRLYGRGSSDDKGPILGWVNVLQAHHDLKIPLPVNLRFCFEGMEESGSEGLDEFILAEVKKGKDGWFDGVDCVCISDNYWLNTRTPCLTYGLRGLTYFKITVSGPGKDLHSGVFGRMVYEPMTDLIALMSKLVDSSGKILIPGVDEMVQEASEEERQIYEKLDYSIKDVEESAGGSIALSDDKATVLMGRMRSPSLSLHGIEGAFYGARQDRDPREGLREVQHPNVNPLVISYIESEFKKLGSKSKLVIEDLHGGKPWVEDYDHWSYAAAWRATEEIYKQTPDLTREGGSIPVTLTFAEALGVNVLLLPMGRGDDGAHSTNEKLDKSNYIEGTKLLGTYLYEVAEGTKGQ
ncbi:hypothetical protein EWM64_g777 [Hericium alpestre]|uniref:Peptidase M20 dimerisation domain-containing protein n=1 Tax=Hericium alpestre TaxID=135208 RepID=A0A4Z0AA74_9AGAM|nr:hypothetical protein EWM64_g777 [Hericium alpestre]